MSTSPPIISSGPTVSQNVPFEIRRHLQLIYSKLNNHVQAFQLQQDKINSLKSGTVTKVFEGGSGGGSSSSSTVLTVNNQSGVTSYATASGDNGALIILSDTSPIAVSLTGQSPPFGCFIANQGAGTATLTPALFGSSTPTISYAGHPGSASMPLLGGYGTLIGFDGSNWWALTMPIVPVTFSAISHQFLTAYDDVTGLFTAAQPAFTDISGLASPSQLPTPTASTLGGVESAGPTAHEWIDEIDTSGVPHLSQPDFTDISGTATAAQIPALSALSGQITTSQLPSSGLSVTITTAALTGTGTQGSMQFQNGILVAQTPAT